MTIRQLQLETSWGRLTVVGGSRAGEGSLLVLPQLRLALDAGRAHRSLPAMANVCVSHGHVDHLGGLAYWASQRYLQRMGEGRVLAPAEIAGDIRALLELHARMEGGRPYEVLVSGVADGDVHHLRPDMALHFFRTDHWVPTLGSQLVWTKHRLRPELSGMQEAEIAELRRRGDEVTEPVAVPLVTYGADTGPALLGSRPDLLRSEVVLLECSFFKTADRQRAARYGHLHLDDLVAAAGDLSCRHLVLLHASRRHRLRDVDTFVDDRVRPVVDGEVHHLNVDWE